MLEGSLPEVLCEVAKRADDIVASGGGSEGGGRGASSSQGAVPVVAVPLNFLIFAGSFRSILSVSLLAWTAGRTALPGRTYSEDFDPIGDVG